MKAYGGAEIQLRTLLTSALVSWYAVTFMPRPLFPPGNAVLKPFSRSLLGPRKMKPSCRCWESNRGSSDAHPIAQTLTIDCAVRGCWKKCVLRFLVCVLQLERLPIIVSCQLTGSRVLSILRPQSGVRRILLSHLRPTPSSRLVVLFTGLCIVMISLRTGHKTWSNGCRWSIVPSPTRTRLPRYGFL